jgi:hypothetical protein
VGKQKMTIFTLGLGALLVALVLLLGGGAGRSATIVLPEMPVDTDTSTEENGDIADNVVQITPTTVQSAISALSRPASYKRTEVVETFWSGGKGQSVSLVSVSGAATRVDTTLADGGVKHMLIVGSRTAVWYDEEDAWVELGQSDADAARRMLSYEDVLALASEEIQEADYRDLDGVTCVYVATLPDDTGYVTRYWVSVSSGLLVAASRERDGETVYRFTSSDPDADAPAEELFLLPDGGVLSPDE